MSEAVTILSEEKLQELAENWQELLRLRDWEVHVRQVRLAELGKDSGFGQCESSANKRIAHIKLLHPDDFNEVDIMRPVADVAEEQERVLIHELLHLVFAPIDRVIGVGTVGETMLEQAINSLDTPLVELARLARNSVAVVE